MKPAASEAFRIHVQSWNIGADMNGLQVGLSALRASQAGIDVSAQNLANANTPGYHRRDLLLQERVLASVSGRGTGVDIDTIRRIRSSVTEGLLTNNISLMAFADARLETLNRIETLISPGDGSVNDRLQGFFLSMHELSSRPGDATLQKLVIERGSQLASQVKSVSQDIRQVRAELDLEIRSIVDEVNNLTQEVASLQTVLLRETKAGSPVNALRDQLERVTNQLAEYIDIESQELNNQHVISRFATGVGVVGHTAPTLKFDIQDGEAVVIREGSDTPLRFSGGKLGGLLSARNDLARGVESDLDQFATDLIRAVDSVHSQGIGRLGSFDVLTGTRDVADPDASLVNAGDFPITSGPLFIYVTDKTTGESTLNRIDIDANTDSLNDLAASISGITGISGVVRPDSGVLTIAASPDHTFDFTGRVPTRPTISSITGTSDLTLSGAFTGADNDTFTLEAQSGGTVGLTDELFIDVRNNAGELVKRLNVGKGYEPGSDIEVAEGVFVSFAAGTLNGGDAATTDVVSNSDPTGALVALGLNSFFSGSSAHDISVDDSIRANAGRFAASLSGAPSDSRNLNRILQVRDAFVALDGTRTLAQSVADLTSRVGSEVASDSLALEGLGIAQQQLETQRDAVSGVDPNEELVKMMNFQRSFQAASRVIASVEAAYDDLFSII